MFIPKEMRFINHGRGGACDILKEDVCDVPVPKEYEVLIEVAFAGVNRPDCFQRSGSYPPPPGASPILGLEVSGKIVALGERVSQWRIGDMVCALTNGGGYAEYVCAPEGQVLSIPKGQDLMTAAALPENFFTVWTNVFQRGNLKPNETFLVHGGSSGIGLTAIQLAHAFGSKVICTVGNEKKANVCKAAGADVAINYKTEDFVDVVLEATEGKGVDLILDMVGGEYIQKNLKALAIDGKLVQIAFLQSSKVDVDWSPLMTKRLTFTGSTLRPRTTEDKAMMANELEKKVWPLLNSGRVRPIIHKNFQLSDAKNAHALMESSEHIGKILLTVSNENK